MKKITPLLYAAVFFTTSNYVTITAQCTNSVSLGSSVNMHTKAKNNSNMIVADKDLNTVIFIHRNNPTPFGGSSGHLRYDISTNGGATWTNNLGPLNPNLTRHARFPNVAIYNPPGNTNPANAYLNYLAPTLNAASNWSGVVSGVRQLNGSGNTETYSQPAPTNQILGSLVKGAPGVFWATDFTYNGSQFTGGILIYKGQWTGNTVNWSLSQQFNPAYNLSSNGNPILGESSIAFDPSGMKGWLCVTAHLSSASNYYRYLPVFYKTTDGGNTWSGPMLVDLSQFNCITSGAGSGNTPGIYYTNDLTVDVFGNPHLIVTVGVGNNAYGIHNNQWHHMFNITQKHGVWTAYDIASVKAEIGTIFPGSGGSSIYQTIQPQISRSADGTKVFFSWSDNSTYTMGFPNMIPEFFARGFDVVQNKWTPVRDFTSCSFSSSGSIFFPHMAAETLEPIAGTYKLAVVYSSFGSNDPDQPANFQFLDNATFSNQDFTINQPLLNPLSVLPGSLIPICTGNFANLQVTGSFQDIMWNNGVSGAFNNVGSPGVYYVGVRQGCLVGWDSVTVSTLSISLTNSTLNACEGVPQNLSVNGNALDYIWTPGPLNGASITIVPVSNIVYTVTGVGINTCNVSSTMSLMVHPVPSVSATSNHSLLCVGEEAILEAAGADVFMWNSGVTTYTTAVSPSSTTDYTVTGYNSAGCSASFTLTQLVDACAGIAKANLTDNQLLVYPNPGAGIINIQSTSDLHCTLSNELGQVLRILELNSANHWRVTLKELPPGIYFLNGSHANAYLYRKIIIQN